MSSPDPKESQSQDSTRTGGNAQTKGAEKLGDDAPSQPSGSSPGEPEKKG